MVAFRQVVSRVMPKTVQRMRDVRYAIEVLSQLGGKAERECPACGYRGRFQAFGQPPRYDARCPRCGALERHRLLTLAIQRRGLIPDGARVLHFAAEPVMKNMLAKRNISYSTADIAVGYADLILNLEDIALPDGSVDVVLANHVLEHVDDRKALKELWRILAPGGCLIVTVPLVEGWDTTYENPQITDPNARTLHFGQWDHVRYYGRDFRDRLVNAGFAIEEFVGTGEEVVKFGLLRGERAFLLRK